jgi:hypothetical protein
MWHGNFLQEKLNSVKNARPFFCDMSLVTSVVVQGGAQIVSIYSMDPRMHVDPVFNVQ